MCWLIQVWYWYFVLPGISAGAQIREKMERTLCLCTALCGKCGSNVYISSELYDTAENVGDGRRDPGERGPIRLLWRKIVGMGVKPGRDGHDPSVCPAGVSGNPMVYRESVEEKLPGLLQLPGMLFFVIVFLIQIWFWLFSSFNAIYPQLLLMAVSLTGCYTYLRRDKTEKLFYELILLAFVNYFSVLLLSNWGPMLLVTYLIMGAVAGLVCLGDYWQKENTAGKKAIQILCLILVLGMHFPIPG